jgi:hypothetical protein
MRPLVDTTPAEAPGAIQAAMRLLVQLVHRYVTNTEASPNSVIPIGKAWAAAQAVRRGTSTIAISNTLTLPTLVDKVPNPSATSLLNRQIVSISVKEPNSKLTLTWRWENPTQGV